MKEWSQKQLEDIFVRGDVYEVQRAEFEKDLKELNATLTWATRLVITQAVVFVAALLVFAIERFAA
ncbi:hypothetical protein LCGC14_1412010 [marine sediment metagenome]|uniref:Uncharacterized protein n=1 Tax=marine sediment metagenome TaxID=412755 RepID=A0A0F9MVQ5_9ZZZZ